MSLPSAMLVVRLTNSSSRCISQQYDHPRMCGQAAPSSPTSSELDYFSNHCRPNIPQDQIKLRLLSQHKSLQLH